MPKKDKEVKGKCGDMNETMIMSVTGRDLLGTSIERGYHFINGVFEIIAKALKKKNRLAIIKKQVNEERSFECKVEYFLIIT